MTRAGMEREDIARLISVMLAPKQGERLLFITDYPDGKLSAERQARQELLMRWHNAAQLVSESRGMRILPVVKYPETGKNNADLPRTASTEDGGHVDNLPEFIASANIVIAMTEFSATAPLKNIASRAQALRVVSMPGVTTDMENAMAADYSAISDRGKRLSLAVGGAIGFEAIFDSEQVPRGTKLYIDARGTRFIVDDGMCRENGAFINFPSGEVFAAPYEGATPEGRSLFGDSQTRGTLPVWSHAEGKVAFLKVERNRIIRVQGDSLEAQRIGEDIARDGNCANIAELGFGINDRARCGPFVPVLEAEKAGVHIAYGRSDHFGFADTHAGKVKADVHRDFVYAGESPIKATVYAVFANGRRILIAERGKVVAV
jgi:leucyl aminopeptidase (aminopeptidase T)